ncbi:MAG: tetratricopeptide repeat protein [Verrucomicrobia bacterium]|nr:MAG: tetratricopeptide repeat protein [Verrucomicrobiota bacterium]
MSMESQESSLQLDLLAWYEVNKKAVFIGLGLIVVAVGVGIVWKHHTRAVAEEASSALLAVRIKAGETNTMSVDALLAVAQQHAGTPAAGQAQLLAGRELFNKGKYAEARAKFESVANDASDPLQAIGLYGLAACYDAENKLTDALKAYAGVVAAPSGAPFANQARLAKASLHEALKQPKEALALYDEIVASKSSALANDALQRKSTLLRAHPELDKPATLTNSVKVLPAAK